MFDPAEKVQQYEGIFSEFPPKTPTAGEPDGPLFGNGDTGVTVGGKGDELTFWLSKNDFWRAYPKVVCNEARRTGVKGLATLKIRSDLLKNAAFSARQKIKTADVELDLRAGESHLHVSAYAPYQQSMVVLRLTAEKGSIPLSIRLEPLEDSDAESSCLTEGNILSITKEYTGEELDWESRASAVCRILEWQENKGVLREGETLTLVITVYTDHDTPNYRELCRTEACGVTPELLEQYRAAHLSWWHAFWETSGVSIPSEPEVEKFWYASHYLMACCCKTGKFAPGIFGNWITTNFPAWLGDYHLNYNYEAPWWGVFSSNKVFLADPYDQPLLDYIPKARENARKELGCRGIYSQVGIGPKGLAVRTYLKDGRELPELAFWGQKSNAAFGAVNMMMRFYSTWDANYAQKYAMPYLLEVADFWEDYLKFEDGRYVIYNDSVQENCYFAREIYDWASKGEVDHSDDFNPIPTLGLLRVVFRGLLDISEYLGVEEDRREKWFHILTHLSDFPTYEREGKTVFRYTERGLDWYKSNSLPIQHIFPCGSIGLSSGEKLLQIARDTITVLDRWCDFNAFPTFFTAAVRVGYHPDTILKNLKEQFRTHAFPNLFIYYGGGGIECCSAVPSCINEMLFQSHEGILRFFPVWERQKDAAFARLRGYGAFVVSAELKKGIVQNVDILSEKGRPCSVLCPWESGMVVLEEGSPVECEIREEESGTVYAFPTKAGRTYRIEQKHSETVCSTHKPLYC